MTFVIHSKPGCPWCERAKQVIASEGHTFREIVYADLDEIEGFKAQGFKTFPQIYDPSGLHIGGFDDLMDHLDPDDF